MRNVLMAGAVALMTLNALPANAQSFASRTSGPAVGVGIICDTSQQAERFVSLHGSGAELKAAMQAVNDEAGNPQACGVATVAFVADEKGELRTMGSELVQIVRVNIIAGHNGQGWQRVSTGTVQYAVMDAPGIAI